MTETEQKAGLRIDIFTLFPGMFTGPFSESIIARAVSEGHAQIEIHDIRDWTTDRHRTVDDRPYGGGAGMVMMAPPIVEAVESVLGNELAQSRILLMTPSGVRFKQPMAHDLSSSGRLAIICGHYEGVDERARIILGAEPVSIGDYVLTGGELPAMVIVDAVVRLLPGVIRAESVIEESHAGMGVEYPHYTRPVEYRGLKVPDILLSGHHQQIRDWRATAASEVLRERNRIERRLRAKAKATGKTTKGNQTE